MATDKQTTPAQDPSQEPVTAGQLGSLVESIKAMTPPRKIRVNELNFRSPFRSEVLDAHGVAQGRKAAKLNRVVFQNGQRCNRDLMLDEEIQLLNSLKPGHYLDNLVTIRLREGSNGDKDTLTIEYPYKTHDQKLAMAQRVRSFVSLLRQCQDESKAKKAKAQDED